MVKLRMARAGAKKRPFYRVVVTDSRSPRDGRFIEQIGTYNPHANPAELKIKEDRMAHWLGVGAKASDTLRRLVLNQAKEVKEVKA